MSNFFQTKKVTMFINTFVRHVFTYQCAQDFPLTKCNVVIF